MELPNEGDGPRGLVVWGVRIGLAIVGSYMVFANARAVIRLRTLRAEGAIARRRLREMANDTGAPDNRAAGIDRGYGEAVGSAGAGRVRGADPEVQ